jgi:hypothetical protein
LTALAATSTFACIDFASEQRRALDMTDLARAALKGVVD